MQPRPAKSGPRSSRFTFAYPTYVLAAVVAVAVGLYLAGYRVRVYRTDDAVDVNSNHRETTKGQKTGRALSFVDPTTIDARRLMWTALDQHLQWFTNRISKIPHVQEPNPLMFLHQYVKQSTPVIMTSPNLENSTAFKSWSDQAMSQLMGNKEISVEVSKSNVFDVYNKQQPVSWKETMPFSSFLERCYGDRDGSKGSDQAEKLSYYWADEVIPEEMANQIYFPEAGIPLMETKRKIWMGCGGQTTRMHYDGFENIISLLSGTKTYLLVPPWQSHLVYPHPLRTHYTMVDPQAPDYAKFPDFRRATVIKVELKAGEMLFIPAFWWHHVVSGEGRSVAVNIFYQTHGMLTDLLFEDIWSDAQRRSRNVTVADLMGV